MLFSAILIPAFNSAQLIGNAVGGRIGIMAARVRAWLMQMDGPDSPLQGAMMRHIRSAAPALGWFRFAQAAKRLDLIAAFLPND